MSEEEFSEESSEEEEEEGEEEHDGYDLNLLGIPRNVWEHIILNFLNLIEVMKFLRASKSCYVLGCLSMKDRNIRSSFFLKKILVNDISEEFFMKLFDWNAFASEMNPHIVRFCIEKNYPRFLKILFKNDPMLSFDEWVYDILERLARMDDSTEEFGFFLSFLEDEGKCEKYKWFHSIDAFDICCVSAKLLEFIKKCIRKGRGGFEFDYNYLFDTACGKFKYRDTMNYILARPSILDVLDELSLEKYCKILEQEITKSFVLNEKNNKYEIVESVTLEKKLEWLIPRLYEKKHQHFLKENIMRSCNRDGLGCLLIALKFLSIKEPEISLLFRIEDVRVMIRNLVKKKIILSTFKHLEYNNNYYSRYYHMSNSSSGKLNHHVYSKSSTVYSAYADLVSSILNILMCVGKIKVGNQWKNVMKNCIEFCFEKSCQVGIFKVMDCFFDDFMEDFRGEKIDERKVEILEKSVKFLSCFDQTTTIENENDFYLVETLKQEHKEDYYLILEKILRFPFGNLEVYGRVLRSGVLSFLKIKKLNKYATQKIGQILENCTNMFKKKTGGNFDLFIPLEEESKKLTNSSDILSQEEQKWIFLKKLYTRQLMIIKAIVLNVDEKKILQTLFTYNGNVNQTILILTEIQ